MGAGPGGAAAQTEEQLCYDGFRCWGCPSLFLSPTLSSLKGPTASLPSLLEPRQSLLSKDSSLEDFGLWAFGVGEDVIPMGEAWQTPVPGHPVGRGQEECVLLPPLAWGDLDRRTMPHAAPSSRGKQVSSRYQSKGPGPPTATAPMAGAGGSPSAAIFAALSSLL